MTAFYRAWHALEATLPDRGLVLDFDMAPGLEAAVAPFPDRPAALARLDALLDGLPEAELANPQLLRAKLVGARHYLAALMGDRPAFEVYLQATMGIAPDPPRAELLATRRAELAEAFADRGIAYGAEGRAAFAQCFGRLSPERLAVELRQLAIECVTRVRRLVPGVPEPHYAIEVVDEDAYWSNWIDGSASRGVLLRINTHERVQYNRLSALPLAAHEIAGHASHVGALRGSAAAGTLDPCALNLAVHSCEAFHMEGLAQVALRVLFDDAELDPDLLLLERHRDYTGVRINAAQLAVEDGQDLEEAVGEVLRDCPLLKPLSVRSSLRDRASHPLYRSYIHVYAPARELFQRALALPVDARLAFFRAAWTGLYTPEQLEARLAEVGGPPAS